ncbi:restriction endonuclease [Micromonospora sp. NPDC047730]
MDALSAGAFEEWIACLLERDGCKIIRRHGGPNDQGADGQTAAAA